MYRLSNRKAAKRDISDTQCNQKYTISIKNDMHNLFFGLDCMHTANTSYHMFYLCCVTEIEWFRCMIWKVNNLNIIDICVFVSSLAPSCQVQNCFGNPEVEIKSKD